jgi:hypothetical protein
MKSTWWFASAEDRDECARNLEKYAPQYGGYCAYGVSQGHTAPIDPEAWTIIEGKLHLNDSKGVKRPGRKRFQSTSKKLIGTGPDCSEVRAAFRGRGGRSELTVVL